MEGRFVHVRGVNYYVALAGSGHPVLLLHGFTGAHGIWGNLMENLQDDFWLIAPDMLGHGYTDCPIPESRYSMEETVTDLVAIAEILGVQSCVCVGYSMGGRIALSFSLTAPTLVKGLVLESSSPGLAAMQERSARIQRDRQLAERIESLTIDAFANEWANLALFLSQKRLSPDVLQRQQQIRCCHKKEGLAQSLRGIGTGTQPSFWQQLCELNVPTLLVTGELDQKFTHIAQEMMLHLPCAVHEQVADAGHTVHLEQPGVFLALVNNFLQGWQREKIHSS